MSFFKSVIRGAGNELGRSTMRAMINPVLKGKDSTPISVGGEYSYSKDNESSSNKGFLNYIGLVVLWFFISAVSMSLSNYIGTYLLGIIGIYYLIKIFSKETIQEYGMVDVEVPDKRRKTGYRIDKVKQVVNEYKEPISKNKKVFYVVASSLYLLFIPISIGSVEDNIVADNNMTSIVIDDSSPNKDDMSYIEVSAYYDTTQSKYTHIHINYNLNDIIQNQHGDPVSGEFFTDDGGIIVKNINNEDDEAMFHLLNKSNKVVFNGYSKNKVIFVKNLHLIRETFKNQ